MFVGLDGLRVKVYGSVQATDRMLLVDRRAQPYLASVNQGDHTFLLLNDGVNEEVVQYDGTPELQITRDGISISVTRGLNGHAFNFSSATVLYYGFCTQVIRDIVGGK